MDGNAVYSPKGIEFGPAKGAANCEKHGISLVLGTELLMGLVGETVDDRRAYDEVRMNAFDLVQSRLYTYAICNNRIPLIPVHKGPASPARV